MAADALEVRIAHLEGAYEQLDKRLGSIESRMASIESRMISLERKVDEGIAQLRTVIDTNYRWVIGIILVNWTTLMLAILLRR